MNSFGDLPPPNEICGGAMLIGAAVEVSLQARHLWLSVDDNGLGNLSISHYDKFLLYYSISAHKLLSKNKSSSHDQ